MSSSSTVCILIFLVAPGTNMQNICFDFVFLVFVFLFVLFCFFVFVINTLSAWNRKVCVNGSFMLFNFLWFCLYCMYFFKGFWGRPQKYRSACERGRTCIFTGYPPPLQLQSGLLCTCITEAPNKTHCGWLVRKKKKKNARLCLGFVFGCVLGYLHLFSNLPQSQVSPRDYFYVSHTHNNKTLQSETSAQIYSTSYQTLYLLHLGLAHYGSWPAAPCYYLYKGGAIFSSVGQHDI